MSRRLQRRTLVSFLLLAVAEQTVRLTGSQTVIHPTEADTVIGVVALVVISGKTAVVPAGTRVAGYVLHPVSLPVVAP